MQSLYFRPTAPTIRAFFVYTVFRLCGYLLEHKKNETFNFMGCASALSETTVKYKRFFNLSKVTATRK